MLNNFDTTVMAKALQLEPRTIIYNWPETWPIYFHTIMTTISQHYMSLLMPGSYKYKKVWDVSVKKLREKPFGNGHITLQNSTIVYLMFCLRISTHAEYPYDCIENYRMSLLLLYTNTHHYDPLIIYRL